MTFKVGNHVRISVAHQFKGYRLGTIVKISRDGLPYVYIWDEKESTRYAYVDTERGDTIVKITKDKS